MGIAKGKADMLSFQNSLSFAEGTNDLVAFTNFWEPEQAFIWSTGKWCEISFGFQASPGHNAVKSADLIVDIDAYRGPEDGSGQNVYIYLNGMRIGAAFLTSRSIQIWSFDPRTLRPSENLLIIDTPEAHSPRIYGDKDFRVLGIQLHSLQIRKNT